MSKAKTSRPRLYVAAVFSAGFSVVFSAVDLVSPRRQAISWLYSMRVTLSLETCHLDVVARSYNSVFRKSVQGVVLWLSAMWSSTRPRWCCSKISRCSHVLHIVGKCSYIKPREQCLIHARRLRRYRALVCEVVQPMKGNNEGWKNKGNNTTCSQL